MKIARAFLVTHQRWTLFENNGDEEKAILQAMKILLLFILFF